MNTKRDSIDKFRQMLKERNADADYTNKFLYSVLFDHAKWLIKREISAGRIYSNITFFQNIDCLDVVESSVIPSCCSVKTNCKMYRTEIKLPDMWVDSTGPVIKSVRSIDNSTDFILTTSFSWLDKRNDPYLKKANIRYVFYDDGYLWFPEHNPHKINTVIAPVDDLKLWDRKCEDCEKDNKCITYLDTNFILPDWIEAEMYSKALQQIVPLKQIQDDEQIDKNSNRKN